MKTESMKLEFEQTLRESEFIGLITPSLSLSIKVSALGSDETKMQWATALKGTRDTLRMRFVELARNGGLNDLKANHPEEFKKLWRAMFLKEPR